MAIIILAVLAILIVLITFFFLILPKFSPHKRGFEFLKGKNYEQAQREFLHAIDKNPSDVNSRYYLALIYAMQGNHDLARKHLQDIVSINRYNNEVERADVLSKLAALNTEAGLNEPAFLNYLEILEYDPGNKLALFQLGFMALGQGEFSIANEYLSKYIDREKRDFEALLALGVCKNRLEEHSEAEQLLGRAVKANSDSRLARMLYAIQLLINKKYSDSLKIMRDILDDQASPYLYFFVKRTTAFLLHKGQRTLEAIRILEELKRFSKQNKLGDQLTPVLYDLAMLFIHLHDWTFGSAYLTMVEYFDPTYGDTASALKDIEYMHNGDETAERDLQQVVSSWENDQGKQFHLFKLSGLASKKRFNLQAVYNSAIAETPTVTPKASSPSGAGKKGKSTSSAASASFDQLLTMPFNDFERKAYHLAKKIDLSVSSRLSTYREQDGIDLLCKEKNSGDQVLLVIRRWKETKLGDIELRNLADYMHTEKIKRTIIMVTTGLTDSAQKTAETMPDLYVYSYEELLQLLE